MTAPVLDAPPSAPTPNLPLLREILAYIDEHPEQHNQDWWAHAEEGCGTTYCVAGWAVHLRGYSIEWAPFGDGEYQADYCRDVNGDRRLIGAAAMELLGLTDGEATQLFTGCDNRDEVRDVAERIAKRAGEAL